MHRKKVTHSNGCYERKSRGWKLADEIGWAKKIPWYTHRLMRRKRVSCELHDSYFRLMTIKHAISKIEWVLNCYITQKSRQRELSSTTSWVRVPVAVAVELETEIDEVWLGKPHPAEGALGNPDGVWGPEKMPIRCNKESHHPAEWAQGLRSSIRITRKTQRCRP